MKKIMILANNDVGLYNFRKELIQALVKDYEVTISLPDGELIPNLKELGCKYIETPLDRRGKNPLADFNLLLKYRKIMKLEKPDFMLSFTIKPNIYGGLAARSLNIPYIANITGLGTAVENKGILQKITVNLYKIAFKKIKTVFFQNEENLQFFKDKKIALGKHQLIPGSGVNLERFPLLKYPSAETIRFVFISRIMKEKGIDQYLEMAAYIKAKYPHTEFHVCGFCEESYEAILSDYEERGIIIYHGMVRNIVEILEQIHCTIHPTYYPEGMSNVLLESAACGKPVITTDRSGCREIVDDGKSGYLVNMKDTEDLINKVELFLTLTHEEKRDFGLAGRKKVEQEFDRNIVVNAYLDNIK